MSSAAAQQTNLTDESYGPMTTQQQPSTASSRTQRDVESSSNEDSLDCRCQTLLLAATMNNRNGGLAVGSPDRCYPGIYFQPQYPAKEEDWNNDMEK